jgi:hypothetical protein
MRDAALDVVERGRHLSIAAEVHTTCALGRRDDIHGHTPTRGLGAGRHAADV